MDRNAIFVATCLAAALGSAVMALVCQLADRMAPRHGPQRIFRLHGRRRLGFTWQQALGAVFISGIIFLLLTVTGSKLADCRHTAFAAQRDRGPVSACSWASLP